MEAGRAGGAARGGSLFARMLLALLAVAILPSAIITYESAATGYESSLRRAQGQLESLAALKASEIDLWVAELQRDLGLALSEGYEAGTLGPALARGAGSPEVRALRAGLEDRMSRAMARSGLFSSLRLLDAAGRLAAYAGAPPESQDASAEDYYKLGLQKSYVSPPFRAGAEGWAVAVARPVLAPGRGAAGVLVALSGMGPVGALMAEPMGLGSSGESYLIGRDLAPLSPLRLAAGAPPARIDTAGARAAVGEMVSGRGLYADYRGVPVIGARDWLPVLQAALLVEMEQDEAFAPMRANLWRNGLVAAAALFLSLGIALLVTRWITRPLRALANATSAVAAGDLGQRVRLRRKDEIGRLAAAFDTMAARLDALVGRLKEELEARGRAAAALEREHARSLQFFDNAAVIMVVLDAAGRVAQVNRRGEAALGWAPGELAGRDWFDSCLPAAGREAVRAVFRSFMAGDVAAPEVLENEVTTRDGGRRLVRWHNSLVLEPGGAIGGLFSAGEDVTEIGAAEERLRASLAEKEVLLRELHHRTKNNMGLIIALLNIQRNELRDPRLDEAFVDTANRIRSMALVHQKLYEAGDLSRLDLGPYLADLARLLVDAAGAGPGRIALEVEAEPVPVLIDTAIPVGLILNELVTNALKYAFPGGRKGRIAVRLAMTGGMASLAVEDDGPGPRPGFDPRADARMGLQTVITLAEQQLKGRIRFWGEGGFGCEVLFGEGLYERRV